MKTGAMHLQSLRDCRDVYIDGQRVEDVTCHPAFRNAAASAAHLYDFQTRAGSAENMLFEAPSHRRVSRWWQLPRNFQELVERRQALTASAELHFGFMGRSPDHVASCISGMYMGLEQFETYDARSARALADYYTFARDNDLYLSYVIINPPGDRSAKSMQDQQSIAVRLCGQDSSGITVTGAKMLGTAVILSNEVFVTTIQPLAAGDEPYALSFVVPVNTKGLKILSRKSYEQSATSGFDNPLSSRFDENDALLYFDEVRVPWERVFIAGDVAMCQKQFHATPAHVFQNYQCQIRLMVKLRFLVGIASRIAAALGTDKVPQVRETLGRLAADAAMVEAFVHAMEVKGRPRGDYFVPDAHTLYACQVLTQEMYPRIMTTIRELAGGNLIMLPSSVADLKNDDIRGYALGAQRSPVLEPFERVRLFKLAWDAIGSEFASRHLQYEMFYAGAPFVVRGHSFRTYDWNAATELVDRLESNSATQMTGSV